MSVPAKQHFSLRVAAHDLNEIDRLARQRRLSRTEYLVNAALGKLNKPGLEQRLDAVEDRLEHLERWRQLSG